MGASVSNLKRLCADLYNQVVADDNAFYWLRKAYPDEMAEYDSSLGVSSMADVFAGRMAELGVKSDYGEDC